MSCSSFTDYNTRMGESRLGDRPRWITGGEAASGSACARHLIRDGASVMLMGRSEDRLRSAADTLAPEAAGGAEVRWSAGDASSEDDVAAAVAAASRADGRAADGRSHRRAPAPWVRSSPRRCPSGSACSTSTSPARSSRSSTQRRCSPRRRWLDRRHLVDRSASHASVHGAVLGFEGGHRDTRPQRG